ncbi:hypothetical protein BDZ94DRAFT_1162755 [Collybia nuda]|uniref:Uncharacterized protein n=1 Tax=Collybia nuda TaxID=64659 RepID=A0A9P5Y8C8_9AGAR|nr:hypothetical protein BDZ94DRAFT_1162755 [Collybia nuda]
MAICVSCIYTTASFLSNAPERSIIQHYIAGIFHSQEWERFCSFLTMVFGKSELHAQLAADALSFSTKAAPKKNNSRSPGPKGMFNQYSSPSKTEVNQSIEFILFPILKLTDDTVPVYDGHKVDFDPSTHLQRIHELFPDFEGEVPQGSFSVVGYTTSVYSGKENQSHISCNVQWVIVLGTPQ